MLQPKRLVLPQIPRREEEAQIRQALKEAREGGLRLVFLGGLSGTGKSYLVEKSLKVAANTWIARTKFDQRRTNAPLQSLRYLLSDLIEYFRDKIEPKEVIRFLDGTSGIPVPPQLFLIPTSHTILSKLGAVFAKIFGYSNSLHVKEIATIKYLLQEAKKLPRI